jgi:hypothetical protein
VGKLLACVVIIPIPCAVALILAAFLPIPRV